MIDREHLVAELAKAHGIRVDPDDPILVTALLNRLMLDDSIVSLEAAIRKCVDGITAAYTQHIAAAQQSASVLVTDAGEWSAMRLKEAAEATASALTVQIQREVAKAERASRLAIRLAWAVGLLGAVSLAGFVGFLLAGLKLS